MALDVPAGQATEPTWLQLALICLKYLSYIEYRTKSPSLAALAMVDAICDWLPWAVAYCSAQYAAWTRRASASGASVYLYWEAKLPPPSLNRAR